MWWTYLTFLLTQNVINKFTVEDLLFFFSNMPFKSECLFFGGKFLERKGGTHPTFRAQAERLLRDVWWLRQLQRGVYQQLQLRRQRGWGGAFHPRQPAHHQEQWSSLHVPRRQGGNGSVLGNMSGSCPLDMLLGILTEYMCLFCGLCSTATCEMCGMVGVRDAFYSKTKRFCSVSCSRSYSSNSKKASILARLQVSASSGPPPANSHLNLYYCE